MDLRFYKMRVCDADLILVDDLDGDGSTRDWAAVARLILDRRRGVGADRLAVLARGESATWLRVFGGDGQASRCVADAGLCAARYLLDSGRAESGHVKVRVPGGELVVDVLPASSLGLSLGPPRALPSGEALDREGAAARRSVVDAGGERFEVLPLGLSLPGPRPAPTGGASQSGAAPSGTPQAFAAPSSAAQPGAAPSGATAGHEPGPCPLDAEAVAVFYEGGTKAARARIRASTRGVAAPDVLPLRLVSREEIWAARAIGGSGGRKGAEKEAVGAGRDAASTAAIALAASAAAGYAESGALVRLKGGALWVEWTDEGPLYAAARPEYVFRGEFHVDDLEDQPTK